MNDPKKQVKEAIDNAKTELDTALAELEKIPGIDPETVTYAAHRLKNYLAVVGAVSDLLKVYLTGHPDDQVRIWIEGLQHAVQLISHEVSCLMHSTNGIEPKLKFEKVDLALLVFRVCNFYQRKADWKKIQIHCDAQPDQSYAWTDRVAVSAIFDNLMSNALKFSESGRHISVKVQAESEHLVCTVQDQGPGFSPEDRAKLFQKGVRLANTPTGGELSTGYGLAIARELVEKLGGSIWCESQPGQGSAFQFRLPAYKETS